MICNVISWGPHLSLPAHCWVTCTWSDEPANQQQASCALQAGEAQLDRYLTRYGARLGRYNRTFWDKSVWGFVAKDVSASAAQVGILGRTQSHRGPQSTKENKGRGNRKKKHICSSLTGNLYSEHIMGNLASVKCRPQAREHESNRLERCTSTRVFDQKPMHINLAAEALPCLIAWIKVLFKTRGNNHVVWLWVACLLKAEIKIAQEAKTILPIFTNYPILFWNPHLWFP